MVFALAVGLALTLAALAVERAGRTLRLPGRMVWFATIAATTIWPLVAFVWVRRLAANGVGPAALALPFSIDVARMVPAPSVSAAAFTPLRALNVALLSIWAIWSGVLLVRMALAVAGVARRRSSWPRETLDGERIRVSPDLGPAVVGVLQPEIVLPEWTLSLDAPFRTLMLRHEVEHRDAGDPRLLFAAAACLVLAPWNLTLWYQARRLRLAVEMDCDDRVLARHAEHDRYGRLLITIAQRQSNLPPALAPTLSEPVTHLERRIRAMMSMPRPFAHLRAASLALVGAAAVAAACAVHTPDQVSGPAQSPADRAAMAADPNHVFYSYQVDKQVALLPSDAGPQYPVLLRQAKVEGDVVASFVVDPDGRADTATFTVIKSTHALFTQAVRQALPHWRFVPAEIQGHPVKQLVQQPFVFRLKDGPADTSRTGRL